VATARPPTKELQETQALEAASLVNAQQDQTALNPFLGEGSPLVADITFAVLANRAAASRHFKKGNTA
jgi:hypothetical protein